jgi:hypothetical protein
MNIDLDSLIHLFLDKVFPFALSFLDEALLLLLSKLGLHLQWVEYFFTVLIIFTLLYWMARVLYWLAKSQKSKTIS